MPRQMLDLSGRSFGLLTAKEPTHHRLRGQVAWLCDCACGKSVLAPAFDLRSGRQKSCGCERYAGTHGHTRTPGMQSYRAMVSRCTNEKAKDFSRYGARGISVCFRWLSGDGNVSGVECFFIDMGPRPSAKHSIDRWPDNNGNYEPANCRWATPGEQGRNKRNNYFLGRASVDVCRETGVRAGTFRQRISKGWTIEQALNPNDTRRRHD